MTYEPFTIIIPTRERSDVLYYAIQSALAVRYPRLTVLVSDNCSSDQTPDVVAGFRDPRLKYIRAPSRLSMSHHWEFALSHVRAGWVTVIGDDDAILPHACSVVNRIAAEKGVEAVRACNAEYRWPSPERGGFGSLFVPLRTGVIVRNSAHALEDTLYGITSYTTLPVLYTGGFVAVAAINRARGTDGIFFRSYNPDVYSGVALCGVMARYAWHRGPLAVNGASRHSNGASNFKLKNNASAATASSSPADLFFSEPNIPFHSDLPRDESGRPPRLLQVCVYEAFLQAGHLFTDANSDQRRQQVVSAVTRTAGPRRREALAWTADFRAQHRLPRVASFANFVRFNFLASVRRLAGRTAALCAVTVLGTDERPLSNCFDAVTATETVLSLAPSRIGAFARSATNAMAGRLKKLARAILPLPR